MRNRALLVAVALLMAGAGCVSAVRKTNEQLTDEALKPISVPLEGYRQATEAASSVRAIQKEQKKLMQEMGE